MILRLLEAAKEFNVGKETLVRFLAQKGFAVNHKPSFKLTEQMYCSLQVEFSQDKKDDQRSIDNPSLKVSSQGAKIAPKGKLDKKAKEKAERILKKIREIERSRDYLENVHTTSSSLKRNGKSANSKTITTPMGN